MGEKKKQQKSEEYKRRKRAFEEKKQLKKQKEKEEKKQERNKKIFGHFANSIVYWITMFLLTMFMFCGDDVWQMNLTSGNVGNVIVLLIFYITIYFVTTIFILLFSLDFKGNYVSIYILLTLSIVLLNPVV